ncbi:protocadherin Fat 4-like [Limulus polyphemus]|uniref:Protocadherin Fat 4-like n=1 Tax=Limulus polyphemus TaxID=6850 RepID=A0ABM1SX13_LIMPO|nr:protocadherin Fat 4-like [Limulus polyphemus]
MISLLTLADNRCYLTNGGSSETFTVNEELPVDYVLGKLQVGGNAGKDGDIVLSLDDDNLPISIEPYTKNLVLRQRLDKEGVDGVQSLSVDVSCSKVGKNDPSITIPVRIIVTDANDNVPKFVGTPYSLNLSEVTVVGTVVMQNIKAIDVDQAGPFSTVEYYVKRGPYSHILAFDNRLEGHLVLTAPLDFETLPKFSITIKAQDQGDPPKSAFTTLTVHVLDADDQNPQFQADKYTTVLPENIRTGTQLTILPSQIRAEDPDVGITAPIEYYFNSNSEEYSYFELDRNSGKVSIKRPLPQNLPLPLTLVIRATQVDNKDRYSLTTLTVTTNRPIPTVLKFLQTAYVTTVLESTPPGAVILTIQTSKSTDTNVRFQLLDDPDEQFAVRNTGEVIIAKPLDFENQQQFALRVMASDGRQSDVALLNITVMNVNDNDPVFMESQYTFLVKDSEIRIGTLVGKVEVRDGDIGDTVDLSIKGPFSKVFAVSNRGELRIRNLEFLNTSVCHVFIVATDNGVPPRQTSVPVTVQFPENMLLGSVMKPNRKDNPFVLMVVFGVLLGTLLVVIVTLTIYILKNKQYRDRLPTIMTSNGQPPINKMSSYMTTVHPSRKPPEQPQSQTNPVGVENPIFKMSNLREAEATDAAIPTDHHSVKTSQRQESGSRGPLTHAGHRQSSHETRGETSQENVANGHVRNVVKNPNHSKIHNIHWPNGSIPRRVKKLSWEDERTNMTELDPDVSVTPLPKSSQSDGRPDLTMYF